MNMEVCDLRLSAGQRLERGRWSIRAATGPAGELSAVYREAAGGRLTVVLRGPVAINAISGARLGLSVGSAGGGASAAFSVSGLHDVEHALAQARRLVASLTAGSLRLDRGRPPRRGRRRQSSACV